MNLNVCVVFLFFVCYGQCMEKGRGYLDLYIHANDILKKSEFNIKNSIYQYARLAERISKSTQIETFHRYNDKSFSFVLQAAADNVTTQPDVSTTPAPNSVSEMCQIHISGVMQGLTAQQPWAFQMIDAIGKPPANLLGGGFRWLGDYEECLSVEGFSLNNNITYSFQGGYYLMSVYNLQPVPPILPKGTTLYIGVCLPNSCSESDATVLVNTALMNLTNNQFIAYQASHKEPDMQYDTRAVIVLVVISFFICIMVAGTAYDIALIQWPKWQKEAREKAMYTDVIEPNEKVALIGETSTEFNYEPGLFGKILLAFSIYTNATKLLNTDQANGSLTAVNGIRFISMTWVILGHSYIFVLQDVDNVITFLPEMMKRYTFPAVSNALVSVDTFFVLSGTLLTYLTLKELKKNDGYLNWGMFYFHRFWRLTPPYMLVMMVYLALFPYIGSGPLWNKDGVEYNYCQKSWYYNFIYINNFFEKPEDSCMAWSWYLANDMQFFVLSPLIILPLFFFPAFGYLALLAFLTETWIATGVMATEWNIPVSMFVKDADMSNWAKMYFRSYFRMGPYLVGMFTGYLLYKTNLKFKINKFVNLIGWVVAAVSACAVLYGIYEDVNGNEASRDVASFYITVHRTVWGAAVAWVIFSCAHGYGGFINTMLSWKAFVPLGRLTYCAYLVHPVIIYHYMYSRRRLIHFTDTEIIYQFLGHLGLSYAAAFIVSLAFEAPMMGLEKVIFKRKGNKK